MRHQRLEDRAGFDLVDVAQIWPQGAGQSGPLAEVEAGLDQRPTPAAPDMPAAIGLAIVAVYAALIGVFFLTMAGSAEATFMIVVSGLYLVIFFAVPALFLKVENSPAERPSLARFMKEGVQTSTGHMSGGSALAQIFLVPALLTPALLVIGLLALAVLP